MPPSKNCVAHPEIILSPMTAPRCQNPALQSACRSESEHPELPFLNRQNSFRPPCMILEKTTFGVLCIFHSGLFFCSERFRMQTTLNLRLSALRVEHSAIYHGLDPS